jgi:hypothetical protein
MATHYGNMKATFYRDFVSQQSLNPIAGAIGGPITFSRNSVATYVGSDGYIKTATSNEPRFTYEYDSNNILQYRGLLIDSRNSNNLFQYSEDFSNAYWTKTNGSISSTSTLSPNGIDNGQKFSLTSAGGSVNKQVALSGGTVGTGTTALKRVLYISIFAKAAECSYLNIKIDNGTTTVDCYYDLSNGTIGSNTCGVGCFYPTTSSQAGLQFIYKNICNMGNGWYRCILCVQDPQLASSANFTVSFTPSTSSSSLTIGSSGDGMFLWGAMFDYGLNVTNLYHSCFSNYIKTTASTNSCAGETCTVSTSDSNENNLLAGYPANECSAYAEFTTPYFFKTTISSTVLSLSAGTKYGPGGASNMRINYQYAVPTDKGYINHLYRPYFGGAYDYNTNGATPILSNNNKMIITNRQFAPITCAMNGVIGTSSSSLIPQRFNLLTIGGTVCYKKIFFIPIYLNSSQIIRLTTL